MTSTDPAPPASRLRALTALVVLVAAEGALLVGFAVFYLVELVVSRPDNVTTALVSAGLALLAGVGLLFVSRGLGRRRRWSRAPALVTQLLLLPVAWDLAHSERWYLGVLLLVAALAGAVLCFLVPLED